MFFQDDNKLLLTPIAYMKSDFKEKFGVPRQPGRADLVSEIVFEKDFSKDGILKGIEQYSYLWIIFGFSLNSEKNWSPTVRPPRLGGNKRVGVFATRSPNRPNPIGLSSVRLLNVKKRDGVFVLEVEGADLVDHTPIYDIKPYVTYTDSHPDAESGFAESEKGHRLEVFFPDVLLEKIPFAKREGLLQSLADDPRPSYQNEPERVYGMVFCDFDIRFKVDGEKLTVISTEQKN